jgi:P27 family predicted phage terminase small subunit
MTPKNLPRAPKGLGKAGKSLWTDAVGEYQYDALELNLLFHACNAADEAEQAKAKLEAAGYVVKDERGKLVENPQYLVLRDSRNCLARLLKQLEPKRKPAHKPRSESWGSGM